MTAEPTTAQAGPSFNETLAKKIADKYPGAELKFKPLWLEDLVGLARNLLKVTH